MHQSNYYNQAYDDGLIIQNFSQEYQQKVQQNKQVDEFLFHSDQLSNFATQNNLRQQLMSFMKEFDQQLFDQYYHSGLSHIQSKDYQLSHELQKNKSKVYSSKQPINSFPQQNIQQESQFMEFIPTTKSQLVTESNIHQNQYQPRNSQLINNQQRQENLSQLNLQTQSNNNMLIHNHYDKVHSYPQKESKANLSGVFPKQFLMKNKSIDHENYQVKRFIQQFGGIEDTISEMEQSLKKYELKNSQFINEDQHPYQQQQNNQFFDLQKSNNFQFNESKFLQQQDPFQSPESYKQYMIQQDAVKQQVQKVGDSLFLRSHLENQLQILKSKNMQQRF